MEWKYMRGMGIALVAALALGLAGCGGGGGSSPTAAVEDEETTEPTEPAAPSVGDLFAAASTAEMASGDAADDAADALDSAEENAGRLSVLQVRGNSTTATMNADAILDARDAVGEALMAAQMALADIEQALADAADHADDPNHAALVDALNEAKMTVEADIEAIEDIRDGLALEGYVETVTGTDADDLKTAEDTGKGVAMEVAEALMRNVGATDSTLVAVSASVPDTTGANAVRTAVRKDDHQGYTWEQLAAKLGLEPRWLSVPGTAERVGSARGVLVDGMAVPTTDQDADFPTTETVDSRNVYDVTSYFKGLGGQLICWGGPCAIKDGKLAAGTAGTSPTTGDMFQGHWYFAPANSFSSTVYYTAVPNDDPGAATTYMVEGAYVSYGYWLSDADTATDGIQLRLNRYAARNDGATDRGDLTTVNTAPATTLTDTSATYEGPAIGLSVHKTTVNGKVTEIYSGGFEAKATLTATWGGSPMLSGSITDFTGGKHVNEDWIVTLPQRAFDDNFTDGVAKGSGPSGAGPDGAWEASAYGPASGARPTGIYGGFNAHFVDGHAAGVYATRKK